MRLVAQVCLVAFSAGLGVAVALRLGTEAMAVVVGVLMGILASLPVALLVLYATRRVQREAETSAQPAAQPAPLAYPMPSSQPPMPQIVVLPAPQAPGYRQASMGWPSMPAPREFHIVGDDE
jgi:hypothetical protein